MIRIAWIIGRKELAQRLRDRSFFIVGIIAPLALAFVFNLVLGGVINGDTDLNLKFGVVDADTGPVSDAFTGMLDAASAEGITYAAYDSADAAQAAVEAGDVDAAFVLPDTLSTAVLAGQAVSIRVIGSVDSEIGTTVANSLAQGFAARARAATISAQATAAATGTVDPAAIAAFAAEAGAAAPPLGLVETDVRSRQLGSSTFFVAGLGLFFMFFVAGMAVTSVLAERSAGTLARLLAAPISPSAILAGKSGASIVLGLIALVFLAVISTFIMDADWGNPVLTGLVLLSAVIAVSGVMMLVGSLARTSEQAQNLQSVVGTTMAMLGGTFVPITSGDGFVANLRFLTPNAWYIRALGDVVGGAYGDAALSIGVLLAFGVICGAGGLFLIRRTLTP